MSCDNNFKIATLHPQLRTIAVIFIDTVNNKAGIELIITHAWRSFSDQYKIYQKGRTTEGKIVTHAKPGESFHNFGLAFDVKPNVDEDSLLRFDGWKQIAQIGLSCGLEWGGNFSNIYDKRHFQKSFGYTHNQLLHKFQTGDTINGYVNLL